MEWTTNLAVHESAAPEFTRERIVAALRRGEIDSSLLYAGLRQTTLWTLLHQAISPSQTDAAFVSLYETAFAETSAQCQGDVIHVVSLGCGSGSKDLRAIRSLRSAERAVIYTPADISAEMVLTAQRAITQEFRGLQCTPLVFDLVRCSVLPAILKNFDPSGAERLILFLGMIQNHWPQEILKTILHPLRTQDRLLLGANLAPSENYEQSLLRILQQYDNAPTRNWLAGALAEIGVTEGDGDLVFSLVREEKLPSLQRIEARFHFRRAVEVQVFNQKIFFALGSSMRVFWSYRFTPDHLRTFIQQAGLVIDREWILPEEGLFLCRRLAQ